MKQLLFFLSLAGLLSCGMGKKIRLEKSIAQQLVRIEKRDSNFSTQWRDVWGKRDLSLIRYRYSAPDTLNNQFIETVTVLQIQEQEAVKEKQQTENYYREELIQEETVYREQRVKRQNPRFLIWIIFLTILLIISGYYGVRK